MFPGEERWDVLGCLPLLYLFTCVLGGKGGMRSIALSKGTFLGCSTESEGFELGLQASGLGSYVRPDFPKKVSPTWQMLDFNRETGGP